MPAKIFKKRVQICLNMDGDMYEQIKQLAEAEDLNISLQIRKLLKKALRK